jgi:LuxR family transcriptional regulator, maltose regulon positive regulatory protein
LALTIVLLDKSKKHESELINLIAANLDGRDHAPFMQFGFETLVLLDEYCKLNRGNSELADFVTELRKFEENLIPLRRIIRRHSEIVQFTVPKLVIRAFGKFQTRIGDHVVTLSEWKTQMVRDLFYFILLHPDGVTKEEIGEAFWPDSTIDTLRVRFKNSIYRLRHALGSESISFIDDFYRFNRTLEYDYDVESFSQELASTQVVSEIDEKISHLRQGINHYKGPYLPKLDYDWALIQREQYHRKFMDAVTELIELLFKTQQYQTVVHYADRMIEEDPSHEEAYRFAMLAFSALGDRASVSRYFEKCRINLQKDLELEPTPRTIELYKHLIQ